jgi:predicted TIM-barrel fold metal-dependent hydrolase
MSIERASRAFNAAAERLSTLYSLSSDYTMLLDLLEDPESDPAEVQAELERVAGDIRAKAYGVAAVVQTLGAMAEVQRNEAKRLTEKARRNEAHADRLRQYAKECMQQLGIERLDTGTFTLAVRVNPPSVNVLDAALVPSEFQRTKIEVSVDKRAILDAFKTDGEIVPGTEIVRTDRLSIS